MQILIKFTKTNKKIWVAMFGAIIFTTFLFAQKEQTISNIKVNTYILDNGLTVLLNEDHSKPIVYGEVVIKAGSKNDPPDHTGIAHYLEHMLFNGTKEFGTTNYQKEKHFLDTIYDLYDSLGKTNDEIKRNEIQKLINQQSLKADEYAIPREIDKMMKSIGSTDINAGTGNDITAFYNFFPPNQIEKWLELYSNRFINPVFRLFQSELEVVYEEKNMSLDNMEEQIEETFLKHFFKKHPYGQQSTIGTIEHLKNPSLSAMYEFYKTYYVANNMALILCGDFNTEEILPVIKEKFGKWKSGIVPEFHDYKEESFEGRELVKVRISPVKLEIIGFRTVNRNNPDKISLDVCNALLSNSEGTGFFDKLMLENKILYIIDFSYNYTDYGAAIYAIIPKIIGQSLKKAELIVMEQFNKLKKGEFDNALLESVKNNIYKNFKKNIENLDSRAELIADAFIDEKNIYEYFEYPQKIKSITKEDIIKVAEKYFNNNYLLFISKMGFPKKQKIKKPNYEPIKPNTDATSEYARNFEKIKVKEPKSDFVNFNEDIKTSELNKGITLYYANNPINDVFSLTFKLGIGKYKIPHLFYAAKLMNYAGIINKSYKEIKEIFQNMGCTYTFNCDDSYLTIKLDGIEENLKPALKLLNELISNPIVENDKIKIIHKTEKFEQKNFKNNIFNFSVVLLNYVIYKDNSEFIRRYYTLKEIKKLNTDSLITIIKKAIGYEMQIHYTGNKYDFDSLQYIFKNIMKFPSDIKPSESPVVLNSETYNENTVFFINRKKAVQSQIWFYIKGKDYSINKEVFLDAIQEYYGGTTGLIHNEIRECRSMAYQTDFILLKPAITGKNFSFIGFIGTQADKTIDAIKIFDSLLINMPENKSLFETIKNLLILKSYISRPGFRELSETIVKWKLKGFTEDPAKYKLNIYSNLSFDDLMNFYNINIKGKPIVICIVGNEKRINMNTLCKFGKIIKLKEKDIF